MSKNSKFQSDFEIAKNFRSENSSVPPNISATVFISDVMIDESLSIEYWKENILMTMGSVVGRPIRLDETTLKKEVGYYASTLVEIDLNKAIPNKVWIETKCGKFEQEIRVPKVPKFCNHCQVIGNYVSECRYSNQDFPCLSIEKLLEVGNSIPSIQTATPILVEASVEMSTTQVLSNISEAKEGEWRDVSGEAPKERKLNNSITESSGGKNRVSPSKFNALIEVVGKQEQVFSKSVGKPPKGKLQKVAPNVVTRKQAHNLVNNTSVISSTRQAITVQVGDVLVTGIHAACLATDRRVLYEELLHINARNLPWMILGEFNVQFSWCNNRLGNKRILCDLDKAFYNLKWLEKFDTWSYKVGIRVTSDHGPLLGGVVLNNKPSNITFGYQSVWTTHPNFIKVIQDSWMENCEGNPTFCFISKLKRLKIILKKWNWEVFGDLWIKVKTTEEEVLAASLESDADPENVDMLNNLVTARGRQELASQQYNELTRSKSRLKWVKEWRKYFFFP
ncbi:uncharacterized protein LOC113334929 [Papaver somniferum]|uniref:uncharacterized protein LOC113334929 n=1 Tax=Papaver somniferum TaxID=3469 RepID=UPI000E6F84C4|nr:uncharacterized protein LOC113334929 [Papaver somniferum]